MEQTLNLHQQALEKIINIQSENVDWYKFVLTILKNDPQAILNAFHQPHQKSQEEKIEEEVLKFLVPNQNGIYGTIPAIKRYKEITGKDLRESKIYVESLIPKAKGLHS